MYLTESLIDITGELYFNDFFILQFTLQYTGIKYF